MSSINYNYNYENRATSTQSIVWSNAEITNCTYVQMQASTPENGYFYHTTDTGKFYFAWGGEYIELNVTGTGGDYSDEIEELRAAVEALDIDDITTLVNNAVNGINAAKTSYDAHLSDSDIHVTTADKTNWNAKQDALSPEQLTAINAVADVEASISALGTAAVKDVLTGTINDASGSDVDNLVTVSQVKAFAGGVTGAMHFRDVVTGSDAATALETVSDPVKGDVAIYNTSEYVYNGSNWVLFGDEGAYDVNGAAASALSSAKDYADSLASNYDVAGAASSALNDAKEYTNTQISGLNWVKSVNGTNGDVIVRTFTEVPDSVENGSEIYTIRKNGTLKDFCDDLKDYLNPEAGTAYLAEVSFNAKHNGEYGYDANNAYNNIGLPDTLGNGELIVYVPIGCDDGPVFELEMHSTDGFDKDISLSGKWMSMYDGNILSPWKGFMTASFEETSDGYQYVAHNDVDGISKYYLENVYKPQAFTDITKSINTVLHASDSTVDVDSDFVDGITTLKLCQAIKSCSPKVGSAYMTKARLTDYPESFRGTSGMNTGELLIYVPSNGLYVIDMYTTNNFTDAGNGDKIDSGKYTTIFDAYYDSVGRLVSTWQATLTCPQAATPVDGKYKYIPTEDWHAASKYYVDNAIAGVSVSAGVSEEFVTTTIASSLVGYATESYVSTAVSNKVDHEITTSSGKALIFNESSGGGAKFEHTDGTHSYTGVNDGGKNGLAAQLYAIDVSQNKGAKLDVYTSGIYYTTGDESALSQPDRKKTENEIAVKGDLADFVTTSTVVTSSSAGLMTSADKIKLDGITIGTFPTSDSEIEDDAAVTPGYATVDDVMAYVQAYFEKKKDEIDDGGSESGDITPYIYVTGSEYVENGTPDPIYIMNQFAIDSDAMNPDKGIEIMTSDEIEGYADGDAGMYSQIFSIDVPTGYTVEIHQYDDTIPGYASNVFTLVTNPKQSTKKYGDVQYNCYVRSYTNAFEGDINAAGRFKIIVTKE